MATTKRETLFDCAKELREFENAYQAHFNDVSGFDSDEFDDDDDYLGDYGYDLGFDFDYESSFGFVSCLDVDFYVYDRGFENFDDDTNWQRFLDDYGELVFDVLMNNEFYYDCDHECSSGVDSYTFVDTSSIDLEDEDEDFQICEDCMEKNLLNWKKHLLITLRSIHVVEDVLEISYPHITIPMSEDFFNYCYVCGFLNQLYECGTRNRIVLMLSGDVESNPGPIMSRPILPCDNNPKGELLEKEIKNIIGGIVNKLRQLEGGEINPQSLFDVPDGVKKINNFIEYVLPTIF